MITGSFRVPERRGIGPSHQRILPLKALGFGALVERLVCAGRGKWRAVGPWLDDFECDLITTQLEVEKFFWKANFLHRDNPD